MKIKLNKVDRMSREEMQYAKQEAKLCIDILIQKEYSLLNDKSILKEILSNNFSYLSDKLFFEKRYEDKSTSYTYILSCWVNEISKLDMEYEDFINKLNCILGINKELPYVIKDAFEYIKSNKSVDELNRISNKIYEYNTGQIDIRKLINEPDMPEVESLKQEISLAVDDYGSNHVSLFKSEDDKYNLIYHSSNNSFCINDEPYLLEGMSESEIESLCESYDIGFEEE